MSTLLSTYATNRDNNFNFIRFCAATLVLFSHSFAIAIGTASAEPLRSSIGMTLGNIAVDIFFVTSGFLITGSFISKNNIVAFAWARILRIYPALIVAMLFCVFIVGFYFTTLGAGEYFSSAETQLFLIKNSTLFFGVENQLPGVFNDIPYKNSINGSLWTLPYEVKMYTILAVALIFISYLGTLTRLITNKWAILMVGILATTLHLFNYFKPVISAEFAHLFYMFFIGATFYFWKERVVLSLKLFVCLLALVLLSVEQQELYFVAYSLCLPYLIFYIVYVPNGFIRKFNRVGDYSYGIYIYAFPIQQTFAALIPGISVIDMILYSFGATLLMSILSWHFIEKRFLKMKVTYFSIENLMRVIPNNVGNRFK
jgi:peptidoglycan/LPS O-acetylase OafA/YrhL